MAMQSRSDAISGCLHTTIISSVRMAITYWWQDHRAILVVHYVHGHSPKNHHQTLRQALVVKHVSCLYVVGSQNHDLVDHHMHEPQPKESQTAKLLRACLFA